jgi:hypothetical protein
VLTRHVKECLLISAEDKLEASLQLAGHKNSVQQKENISLIPGLSYAPTMPTAPTFYQSPYPPTPHTPMAHIPAYNNPLASAAINPVAGAIDHASKRLKISHSAPATIFSPSSGVPSTSRSSAQGDRQTEFDDDLCNMFTACGIPFNVVANPAFRWWIGKWILGVHIPGRDKLSGALLTKAASKVIAKTATKVRGQLANYQCDGWKNVAKTSVVTSVMVVSNQVSLGLR